MSNATSFNPDRPINSAGQDKLGRAGFARAIADRIAAWNEKDSLVAALYGGWGSGKSSVKNMIREHLLRREREESDNNAIPIIVEFCPWEFSGSNQLCEEFFGTLAEAFRELPKEEKTAKKFSFLYGLRFWKKEEYNNGAEAAANRLEQYSKLLTFGMNLAAVTTIVATPIAPPVAAIAAASSAALQTAANTAKSGSKLLKSSEQSLNAIKAKLRGDFEKLERKFLVIIDDIDRLTSEEICLLIRLIKANSDFPNLIFLLLVQRETVEKALDRVVENKGAFFLEKIVQVPFDMPQPRIGQIHQYVAGKVYDMFSQLMGKSEWDKYRERWNSVWSGALCLYFENFRIAHRYVNTLVFTAGAFKTPNAYQVNPVDLAIIEVFRVFEPTLFASLSLNKDRLTDETGTLVEEAVKQLNGKEETDKILPFLTDRQARIPQEKLRRILADLFPVLDGITSDDLGQTWKRERRIVSSYFFDRYFQLALPPEQVSEEDISSFIKKSEDYDALSSLLNKWINEGMLEDALNRLDAEDFIQAVPKPDIVIGSLLDNLEYITTESPYYTANDISKYAAFWLKRALRNITDAPQRDSLVLKIVEATKPDVVMGLFWFYYIIGPGEKRGEQDEKLITPEATTRLADKLANRIHKCVEQNLLFTHPKYVGIYWMWHRLAQTDAQDWARRAVIEQKQGAKILSLFANENRLYQFEANPENAIKYQFNFQKMEQLAPLALWESALDKIDTAPLNEEEHIILQCFLKTMALRRRSDSAGN